jgi:ribose transport system permease protein
MISTAAAGWSELGSMLAIPFGVGCGLAAGLINGYGVAYLRVPSMIFTLSTNVIAQDLMEVHTSGFAPQEHFTKAMHAIAVERSIFGIPNAACFVISGALAGLAGVLLAGYSTKAYQAMGDAYLLPAIASVVLGGTSILGGRGSYIGTIAGVILITLLQSILSIAQMPEAGRQVIYGVVIVAVLLIYGPGAKVHS